MTLCWLSSYLCQCVSHIVGSSINTCWMNKCISMQCHSIPWLLLSAYKVIQHYFCLARSFLASGRSLKEVTSHYSPIMPWFAMLPTSQVPQAVLFVTWVASPQVVRVKLHSWTEASAGIQLAHAFSASGLPAFQIFPLTCEMAQIRWQESILILSSYVQVTSQAKWAFQTPAFGEGWWSSLPFLFHLRKGRRFRVLSSCAPWKVISQILLQVSCLPWTCFSDCFAVLPGNESIL